MYSKFMIYHWPDGTWQVMDRRTGAVVGTDFETYEKAAEFAWSLFYRDHAPEIFSA